MGLIFFIIYPARPEGVERNPVLVEGKPKENATNAFRGDITSQSNDPIRDAPVVHLPVENIIPKFKVVVTMSPCSLYSVFSVLNEHGPGSAGVTHFPENEVVSKPILDTSLIRDILSSCNKNP